MMWKVLKKMGGQACWVPGEVPCTGHRLLLLHVVLLERDIQHPQQEDLQLLPLPILSVGDPSFCGRRVLPRELDCGSPKACGFDNTIEYESDPQQQVEYLQQEEVDPQGVDVCEADFAVDD